ncbi:MAG: 50S ribosomal protein L5 [Patescibacteria group bacterium]|nr:50S ribosomal protein L5 [Patescibacteria group bacterium]
MNLYDMYKKKIAAELQNEFSITNVMAVPRIIKVAVNCGIGTRYRDNKDYSDIEDALTKITGQKPALRKARKSVSNFKLREGTPNALVVTLRGKRMWDLIERLVRVALPRVRDFRGISPKLDGHGNYSLGIKENAIFPETDIQDLSKIYGLQFNITTSAKNDEQGHALLAKLGFPFKKFN